MKEKACMRKSFRAGLFVCVFLLLMQGVSAFCVLTLWQKQAKIKMDFCAIQLRSL